MIGKGEKENVCIGCRYYEDCGRPERFMKCLGYEQKEDCKKAGEDEEKVE